VALNAKYQVITAPGATGNQTYNLAAGFDPKLVIAWTSYATAAGATDGDKSFIQGFGTYRGSVVQQWHEAAFYDDANAADNGVRIRGSSALLRSVEALGTTIAFEVDLVSMTNAGTPNVILNWVDLPASSIKVHMLVLGGSDITDALVGSFTTSVAAASQNVTVVAGFGKPDLMLFPLGTWTNQTTTADDIRLGLGVATSATSRRTALWGNNNAAAAMTLGAIQSDRAVVGFGATPALDFEADVDNTGHADGFTLTYSDQSSLGFQTAFVALKGTFVATVGSYTAPSSTGTQDITGSGTPKAALLFGTHTALGGGALDTSSARLGGFWMGAYDGTDEGSAGMTNEDASVDVKAGWHHSETKAVVHLDSTAGAPTVTADADATWNGSDLRLTWTTVDATVQAGGNVLILAEATSAAAAIPNLTMSPYRGAF
jgi:hypothetical protein